MSTLLDKSPFKPQATIIPRIAIELADELEASSASSIALVVSASNLTLREPVIGPSLDRVHRWGSVTLHCVVFFFSWFLALLRVLAVGLSVLIIKNLSSLKISSDKSETICQCNVLQIRVAALEVEIERVVQDTSESCQCHVLQIRVAALEVEIERVVQDTSESCQCHVLQIRVAALEVEIERVVQGLELAKKPKKIEPLQTHGVTLDILKSVKLRPCTSPKPSSPLHHE